MLKAGDCAPAFELPDQDGKAVTLDGLLAQGELILYFYPADFTPVCTREACEFRDRFEDLAAVQVQIVGVSPQSAKSHQQFRSSFSLPFPLLCDEGKTVIDAFGVNGPLGFGVRRATYLIGVDRTIRSRVVADIFLGSHMDLIRQVIAERSP
ncbi:MAG: peroxiredoxin [Gammaproteobacteria bacterium]|nr:peroxiredoxin [Gammaproteobacteria bacterium]